MHTSVRQWRNNRGASAHDRASAPLQSCSLGLSWLIGLVAAAVVLAGCGADVNVATDAPPSPAADVAGEGETTDPPAPGAEAEPDPSPDEDEPAATDDAEPSSDPDPEAAEPDAAAIAGAAGVAALAEDLPEAAVSCAIDGLLENRELARAVLFADDDDLLADLPPDLADQAIDIVLACTDDRTFADLVVAGFEEDGNDLPDSVAPCFADELDTDEERRALIEAGLADEGDVAPETVALIVDTVAGCVPPDIWVDVIFAEVGDDETFEAAVSPACLEELFGDEAFVATLLMAAFNGEFDDDEITPEQAPLIRGLFDCIDFGVVIAAEAAADGIELSASSVDCISDAFRELGLVESFISGVEPSEAELGQLIFDCLSRDELADLLGS